MASLRWLAPDLGRLYAPSPRCSQGRLRTFYPVVSVTALDDLTLTDDDGRDVRLKDLWAERPAALVFLRHYG